MGGVLSEKFLFWNATTCIISLLYYDQKGLGQWRWKNCLDRPYCCPEHLTDQGQVPSSNGHTRIIPSVPTYKPWAKNVLAMHKVLSMW